MQRRVLCLALVLIYGPPVPRAQESRAPQAAIAGVIAAGARVEEVRGGFKGLEGPVAAPDGGLFFSDIPANITYKLEPNGTIAVWRENTNGANGLFFARNGRLLAAEGAGRRIVAVTPDKRAMPLATAFNGQPLRGPNDVIADSRGGIYFTDPAPRPAPDVAPKEPGNVHYLSPKGEVLVLDGQIRRPNGLTLSIDEKTLYVGDTEGEFVYAFDVAADGRVSNKRQFARLIELEKGSVGPRSRADGMAIDAMGRLYVSTAAGIQVFNEPGNTSASSGCRLWRGTSPLAAKTAARCTSRRSGRYIACRCWPKVLPAGRSRHRGRPMMDAALGGGGFTCMHRRAATTVALAAALGVVSLRAVIEAQAPPTSFHLMEATIDDIHAAFGANRLTCRALDSKEAQP